MLLLNDHELENLLPPLQLVNAVEAAMISDEAQENFVPQRMHIPHAGNTYLLMPAYGKESFGTKLVSVVPENTKAGLPVINGMYSLNDSKTGIPLALMNASKLTALRTGAIAAVAIRALTKPEIDTIGIIGPGVQAVWAAVCTAAIRPVKKIFVLGRSQRSLENFIGQMKDRLPEVEAVPVANHQEMLRNSSVIISATTSDVPVLTEDQQLLSGKTFIAMGSYRKDMRELPDAVFKLSNRIIIDAPGTKHEVGDVLHPVQKGHVSEENVITLGSILTGKNQLNSGTTVFKSAGYALFDLFTAQRLYMEALSKGKGITFNF
jgi:ornithine cyclodeaminase